MPFYRPSRSWPTVSRNASDILNLFGPESEPHQRVAQQLLRTNAPILGCDLEYNEPERYVEVPTILGVSDGALTVSVDFHDGLPYFKDLLFRYPNIRFLGHAFASADYFAFRQVGIDLKVENIEDTIIRHALTSAHLCKGVKSGEEDESVAKGKGYMNIWTFLSLYTSLRNYKSCIGDEECEKDEGRPCRVHREYLYNGVDSVGPLWGFPHILKKSIVRGVEKLYPLHRDLVYVLGEMARSGIQTDREYLYGEGGLQKEFERQKANIENALPFNPKSNKVAIAYFKAKDIILEDWQETTIREACEESDDEELHMCLAHKELGAGVARWYAPVTKNKAGNWKGYMDAYGRIHPRLGMFCVDDSSECLTQRGWKRREDLIVGEMAASYDMNESKLMWEPIKNIHYFTVRDEPMVQLKARNIDALVTKNHRMVVRCERWKVKEERIKLAEDLKYSDALIVTAPWKDGEGKSPINECMAEIIGWYVAEGFAKKEGNCVDIYQSETANPDKTHRIKFLLDSLEAEYESVSYEKKYQGKDYKYVAFHIKGFVAAKLRELCPDKSFPIDVLAWEEKELRCLLEGFLQGDGGKHGNGWVITQKIGKVSNNNVNVAHAIAIRLGLPSVKFIDHIRPKTGVRINSKRFHRICPDNRRSHNSKTPYDIVEYSGIVWCPEMNNTTWVMRRNGYVCITGNTSTGRLQCVSPNLQNVSARRMDRYNCECGERIEKHPTEKCEKFKGISVGKLVRRGVVPSPGWILLESDYSNAENRNFLHQAGHAIPLDVDGHTQTAEFMGLTPDMEFVIASGGGSLRQAAKTCSHGSFYLEGIQLKLPREIVGKIKKEIDIGAREIWPDWTFNGKIVTFTGSNLSQRVYGDKKYENRIKAVAILKKLFDAYPGARELQRRIGQMIERQGATITPHGYYLIALGEDEEKMKTAAAMMGSNPVAHLTKLALVESWGQFQKGRPMRPILQVHDSIIHEFREDVDPQQAARWAEGYMARETPEIPGMIIPVEHKWGMNWRDMVKVKI